MNNISSVDLLTIINIYKNEFVPIEDLHLKSPQISPEEQCIRQDLFQKLSEEAKEILRTIIIMPTEFAQAICREGVFYKYGFFKFFRDRLKRKAPRALEEVKEFLFEINFL